MFGRRKREDVARAEQAREAERRALFEQLAKRPETVCPFLGLAGDRAGYQPEPNGEHRCYAFGDPAPLSDEQQRHVCLERGYSNCPRYLRGVLVIPTEELEALRRPQPHIPGPPPPPPRPVAQGGGRRRRAVWIPLLILLVAAVGTGGLYLLNRNGGIAFLPTPSPSASPGTSGSASATETVGATATAIVISTATPTPIITPLPTPTTGSVFVGYWVVVHSGNYTLFRVDASGATTATKVTPFSRASHATVKRVDAPNHVRYWQTQDGVLTGWSYIRNRSGDFQIFQIFRGSDGRLEGIVLDQSQT